VVVQLCPAAGSRSAVPLRLRLARLTEGVVAAQPYLASGLPTRLLKTTDRSPSRFVRRLSQEHEVGVRSYPKNTNYTANLDFFLLTIYGLAY
jgi:hypothetical protein